ncbi:MAG: FxsB family cyclophane-forming radical SAM/SPASM peptide maturase [Streptosporangiaceae bacterium]
MSRPLVPLSQVVLKVHSRCDLACDHCYVYEAADQSWRGRPMVISQEVTAQAARRIADHAVAHSLSAVQVILHGGEPLLAGPARLRGIITTLRSALDGVCDLDLRIHTNGVLLTERFCTLFAEHQVKVGISIDGDRAANDRHRRYADGRSSYDQVIRAIGLLGSGRFRDLYAGLLCTIDVANDPLMVYESLMDLRPPRIDFLLPHATWDHPPARSAATEAEYARWLIAIFDRWLADGCPSRIRTFDSILSTLRGGESYTEALGLDPAGLVVIETGGSYEQVDSLKAAFDGAPETGTDVFAHSLDTVAAHPGIQARQQGAAGLCQTCRRCPVLASCGGGLYPHRYRTANGFDNPSVYCTDLLALISHISSRLPARPAGRLDIASHTLDGGSFQALAGGSGDAAGVAQLIEAEHSLVRGVLSAVYQAAEAAPAISRAAKADLRGAWSLLAALDHDHAATLNAVLSHPYVRVWALRCLAQLRPAGPGPGDGDQAPDPQRLMAELGHLAGITAAAAARARVGAAVTVPVLDGAVHLPTLGRLALGSGAGAGLARHGSGPAGSGPAGSGAAVFETAAVSVISNAIVIRVDEACWTLDLPELLAGEACAIPVTGTSRPAEWQPVRMLQGPGFLVALEDTDPFRDCYHRPAAARLTGAEFARWQEGLRAAWPEIERHGAAYAPSLAAGLSTLMPLAAPQDGREASAAARTSFGAVALALPDDPVTLARLLVQEFQQVKLGAILDLYDLYNPDGDRLFPAPWGEGKLHLEGLLRGAYAQLAVTAFWRARQEFTTGPSAEMAGQSFARCRADTAEAIETLLDSGSLTPLGMSFAREMCESVRLSNVGPEETKSTSVNRATVGKIGK